MPASPPDPPSSTYRLQLGAGFTLNDARGRLPHLVELGVSHVYLSPVLASVPGSTHGYDVIDHGRVAEHLGGDEAFERFTDAADEAGLGVVIDLVPNHFSIEGGHNRRWLDVLEHGPSSASADWFDIDWTGREEHQRGTVVLPVLGDLYGELLEAGELTLVRHGARFAVDCPGHRFPLAPRSLPLLLEPATEELRRAAEPEAAPIERLAFLTDALERLAPATTATERAARGGHLRVLHELLGELLERAPVAGAVDAVLDRVNRDPDAVHRVLETQHYRLAEWRTGAKELDYRRFFDIASLAAIRVERPEVFDAVHELPLRWVHEGRVQGLRIDHPDGLADPRGYFDRLRDRAPRAWIVAEKILGGDERLPEDWVVAGTTGYDALRLVLGTLVDPDGEALLDAAERRAHELCGEEPAEPAAVVRASKQHAVEQLLAADLERVVDVLLRVAERRPRQRDHPRADLRRAVAALAVGLDVYRTYVVPRPAGGRAPVSAADEARVDAAADRALAHDETLDPRLVRFLADVLALRAVDPATGPDADEAELVVRFQQLTGPATAKGLEDTAWYRLGRFVAANEVGADPCDAAVGPHSFHAACRRRQRRWPATMTTLSTHDTKRSADVRARLALLSEPGLRPSWGDLVDTWVPRLLDAWPGGVPPHAPTLLLALQSVVGAWPIDRDRLGTYLLKAAREAKERTSWARPDDRFEAALGSLADAVTRSPLARDLDRDTAELRRLGWHNSLVQTAIGLLQPGVPDVYQGTETGELSLVDPDNRRPVDHDRLARLLRSGGGPHDPGEPDTKLALTAALLALRRRRPACFGAGPAGAHRPLPTEGADAHRLVAFARGDGACAIAARFPTRGELDPDTTIVVPPGDWSPVFGGRPTRGGRVAAGELLGGLPVAVLEAR